MTTSGWWGALAAAALGVVLQLGRDAAAEGPSFDCATATDPIEMVICGDAELAKGDAAMAETYGALRQNLDAEGRETLLREQRLWLQARFDGCAVPAEGEVPAVVRPAMTACLVKLYAARTEALRAQLAAGRAAATAEASGPGAPPVRLVQTVFPATGEQQTI